MRAARATLLVYQNKLQIGTTIWSEGSIRHPMRWDLSNLSPYRDSWLVPINLSPYRDLTCHVKRFDETGHKIWPNRVETHFLLEGNISTKMLIFFTPAIFYTHLSYQHITFLWHTLYFSLHMHSPIICIIIYFGKIIIDMSILWKEKKYMYYFLKENK